MLPQLGGDSGDYNQRQILDAYWEFVRENPQDFNGWAYLIQVWWVVPIWTLIVNMVISGTGTSG